MAETAEMTETAGIADREGSSRSSEAVRSRARVVP